MDKLHRALRIARARRAEKSAKSRVPFHKFAELVKTQVTKLKTGGTPEVAFRVAVKDGKVSFTARGLKGANEDEARARGLTGANGRARSAAALAVQVLESW